MAFGWAFSGFGVNWEWFQRGEIWAGIRDADRWLGPVDSIGNDALNLRVMVGRIGLVAWAEIKHASIAALPCRAAAKDLAAGEPGNENQLIWRWNTEGLALHLLGGDFKIIADACCDGVVRSDVPDAFLVGRFAPFQGASRSHEGFEDFRVVAGVEDNEPHAL